ncbi:MAG: MFS transporter, partial [Verrucomicrobia bacterium]|nr:MFS transporter [Verrucomicrobiota bacterium]
IASFRETFSIANLKIIRNLLWIFLPIPIFWSLFDQSSSAWIFQASRMDLHFLGMELLPAQTHIFNPLLVLIFIPIFNYGLYPALNKLFRLTPLRKIGIGMFITAVSFLMAALIEHWIVDLKETPTIWWQVLSYGFLTTSEVMVSITCLEFSYTQAPKKLKSLIMATYYLSVTAGNLFTSLVNFYINDPVTGQNKLGPVEYYIFFAAAMVCANILFVVIATRYKETPQSESLNA